MNCNCKYNKALLNHLEKCLQIIVVGLITGYYTSHDHKYSRDVDYENKYFWMWLIYENVHYVIFRYAMNND